MKKKSHVSVCSIGLCLDNLMCILGFSLIKFKKVSFYVPKRKIIQKSVLKATTADKENELKS